MSSESYTYLVCYSICILTSEDLELEITDEREHADLFFWVSVCHSIQTFIYCLSLSVCLFLCMHTHICMCAHMSHVYMWRFSPFIMCITETEFRLLRFCSECLKPLNHLSCSLFYVLATSMTDTWVWAMKQP